MCITSEATSDVAPAAAQAQRRDYSRPANTARAASQAKRRDYSRSANTARAAAQAKRRDYGRSVKAGLRFSRKEAMPSCPSAVRAAEAMMPMV